MCGKEFFVQPLTFSEDNLSYLNWLCIKASRKSSQPLWLRMLPLLSATFSTSQPWISGRTIITPPTPQSWGTLSPGWLVLCPLSPSSQNTWFGRQVEPEPMKGHLGLPTNSGLKLAHWISHYVFFPPLENSTWFSSRKQSFRSVASYFINNELFTSCSEYTPFPPLSMQRSPLEMIIPWTTFSHLSAGCFFPTFALGNQCRAITISNAECSA